MGKPGARAQWCIRILCVLFALSLRAEPTRTESVQRKIQIYLPLFEVSFPDCDLQACLRAKDVRHLKDLGFSENEQDRAIRDLQEFTHLVHEYATEGEQLTWECLADTRALFQAKIHALRQKPESSPRWIIKPEIVSLSSHKYRFRLTAKRVGEDEDVAETSVDKDVGKLDEIASPSTGIPQAVAKRLIELEKRICGSNASHED